MISSQDVILAGVSGGADSICLLLLLLALQKTIGFKLEAIHVEHGIRGQESLKDAAFVEDLCSQLQIVCHRVSVDVPAHSKEMGMGIEEAARVLRYEAFSKLAKERNAKIALAHHMEDNAETILFHLVRGSSLTGLCGMQPIRKDENGVEYIRPLLWVHREEIEHFLKSQEQDYRIDSTNEHLEYSRNFLRKKIVPELELINEQAVAHINEMAYKLWDMKDYLEEETKRLWKEVAIIEGMGQKEEIRLLSKKLSTLHPALQKEIVYKTISLMSGSKKDITSIHVDDVLALDYNQSGKRVSLPNDIVAQKEYDSIRFYQKTSVCSDEEWDKNMIKFVSKEDLKEAWNKETVLEIPLKNDEEKLRIRVFPYLDKTAKIPKKAYTKWLDYDKIEKGFCIRTRHSGDYFISDTSGHRKKLKQYFIDEKILSSKRDQMWLLAEEDLVLWLIGGRISEHLKLTEETQMIVEIEYQGGK